MYVLITYDVETKTSKGKKRLRHVAKLCKNYGQRVQNSVFELKVYPADLIEIKSKLSKIIDKSKDSIRIYNLGKNWANRIEILGKDDSYNPDTDLIIV